MSNWKQCRIEYVYNDVREQCIVIVFVLGLGSDSVSPLTPT